VLASSAIGDRVEHTAHALMGYVCPVSRSGGQASRSTACPCSSAGLSSSAHLGRRIAIVHQNPLASLRRTMRVGEPDCRDPSPHRKHRCRGGGALVATCLHAVTLRTRVLYRARYPHQLAGAAKRIMIAIALSLEPDLMILDEPTTNLDATTEAVHPRPLDEIKPAGAIPRWSISATSRRDRPPSQRGWR